MTARISSYRAFWPYYLHEHAQPMTRRLHLAGTGLALACIALAAFLREPWFLFLALVAGYGPAWTAHFFVEKNRPATFTYPLWSLFSDLRMAWLWSTGRLNKALEKAGIVAKG